MSQSNSLPELRLRFLALARRSRCAERGVCGQGRRPSSPARLRNAGILFLSLFLGLPLPAHPDGIQTGTIAGTVLDLDGLPIEGARVRVVGPQQDRNTVTDAAGRFRFPSLEPAVHRVEARLLSLIDRRDDVAVFVGRTSTVRLELREGSETQSSPGLEPTRESIQVVAQAPLVDLLDTRVGATVSRTLLDVLPLPRFYQSVALMLPDVAGGEDGNPDVAGATRDVNVFLVDGVDTTDPTTGLFGLKLAYESSETVDVITAGVPAELGRAGGAAINVVTRSGGDRHRGNLRFLISDPGWGSDFSLPSSSPHLAPEVAAANSDSGSTDQSLGASLGGPILPQRLWYFVASEDRETHRLRPARTGELWDGGLELDSQVYRLTWRPAGSHSVSLQHSADSAEFRAFTLLLGGPAENVATKTQAPVLDIFFDPLIGDLAGLSRNRTDGYFSKLEWNAVLGSDWTVGVGLARQERELDVRADRPGRITAGAPHAAVLEASLPSEDDELLDFVERLTFFNGITDLGLERRPREQASLSVGWFTRFGASEHDLRFGLDFQRTESDTDRRMGGASTFDRETGIEVEGQLFLDFDRSERCLSGGPCDSFDPSTGRFEPFALFNFHARPRLGTRSTQTALYLSDSISWDRWLFSFGLRFEHQEAETLRDGRRLVDHAAVSPRLAVKVDPWRDGKTLFSLHLSRYFESFPHAFLDTFERFQVFSGSSQYFWAGDFEPRCALEDPADLDSSCWFLDSVQPFVLEQGAILDGGLERARIDELAVGFERQLSPSLALHLHWIHRRWEDLWDDLGLANGGFVVTNIDLAEREHTATRVLLQKRFTDRWQLLASYTHSETDGNLFTRQAFDPFADLVSVVGAGLEEQAGAAPYERPNQLKVFGHVQWRLGGSELGLGSALRFESGTPWETLELGSLVEARGSRRLPDLFQWDVSLTMDFHTGTDLDIQLKLDAFNLTDSQEWQQVDPDLASLFYGRPRVLADIQEPRRFQASVELRF
ncbi:MAG: TonB-dependent receptor [Holophagales bacterium]|nr:TonB-dependent receptor [Holophagales bacterium]